MSVMETQTQLSLPISVVKGLGLEWVESRRFGERQLALLATMKLTEGHESLRTILFVSSIVWRR